MKHTARILITTAFALFIGGVSSRAENWTENLYVDTDIGPAFIPDATTHGRDFNYTVGEFVRRQGHFEVDPGLRGDLSLGYRLNKSFAIEAEAGAIWNPGLSSFDNFYQIPVILKAVYQVKLSESWKAYLNGGAGGVIGISETAAPRIAFHNATLLHDTDVAIGYEGEAGIKYTPCQHIELGLGYKFLGVDGYNFTYRAPELYSNFRINALYTHTAFLSFSWKF